MPINIKGSKQTLAYSYNGVTLLNNIKGLTTDTQNIDKIIMLTERSQTSKSIYYIIPLM